MFELESGEFVPEKISDMMIKEYFAKNNLSWKIGWPNKNLCKTYGFVNGQFRQYSEDDPVILNLTNNPIHFLNE